MKSNPAIPYEPIHKAAVFSKAIDFPIVTQSKQWTCGPAVVRAMLKFHGIRRSEAALAKMMKTTKKYGTTPHDVLDVLDDFGLCERHGEYTTGRILCSYVKKGIPVIILWNDWDGHWAVVVGYDAATKSILLMDPANQKTGLRVHKLRTFIANWDTKVRSLGYRRFAIVCKARRK